MGEGEAACCQTRLQTLEPQLHAELQLYAGAPREEGWQYACDWIC